jgi:ubiquinol-cytochrome c reductase subunit 7
LPKDNPVTTEALRRLPKEVYQERQFRLAKAISVSANKAVLPEAEWIKPEEDVSYLKPFIQQVSFYFIFTNCNHF